MAGDMAVLLSDEIVLEPSEYDRSEPIDDDPPLEVRCNRARQHNSFHVATHPGEVARAHPVVDSDNVLVDDRALIKIPRGVVGGCAHELDSAYVRLVIRPRPLEGRQKAVMDVDDRGRLDQEILAHDLHVPGENDEVDAMLDKQTEDLALLICSCRIGYRESVVGDPKPLRDVPEGVVVADDEWNVTGQLPLALPEDEVVKARVLSGDQNGDARKGVRVADRPGRVKPGRHPIEVLFEDEAIGGGLRSRSEVREVYGHP